MTRTTNAETDPTRLTTLAASVVALTLGLEDFDASEKTADLPRELDQFKGQQTAVDAVDRVTNHVDNEEGESP